MDDERHYDMSERTKTWVFTLNNYTEEEVEFISSLVDSGSVKYLCFGKEVGEGGTPHLQGYFELATRGRLSTCKELVSARGHFEKRRGSQQQAVDYCKKDGVFVEFGCRQRPGGRTDLAAIKLELDSGRSLGCIVQSDEFSFGTIIQYRRGLEWYAGLRIPRRSYKSLVSVYWGPTGSGKSSRVYRECSEEETPLWSWPGGQWFDGYTGQKNVIFDDFRGEIGFSLLLRLLDRYPMQVPIKGGHVEWSPEKIYITSNQAPEEWYAGFHDEAPLMRRIEVCEFIGNEPLIPPDVRPNVLDQFAAER